jgi:uroporphyrinogen decarboxylase
MSRYSEMNSRERMLAAMRRQPVDRVPTDIWATPEVFEKLRAHFGEGVDLSEALHIDGMAWVGPEYVGPKPVAPEGESADMWGIRSRPVRYPTGIYQETCFHPLAFARTVEDLDRYTWPQTEWFDYSRMRETAVRARETKAVQCGYMALFYMHNLLRGLEQSLVDPLEDPDFTRELLGRISDFLLKDHRRRFEACDGLIDVAQVTDDYGSQNGPLISLEIFREFYRPHLQRFIDLCKEFGILVFHHDDGAMRMFLPDLVEMGIDILNPVQWTCPGMDMTELKKEFGGRLCFHGGVENQRILPFGSPEDVRREVRHCIDALASDRTGYILASCHNLQPVTPVENVVAMYDEAWQYGKF